MEYRVYVCDKGYKIVGTYNKDDLFFLLDLLILEEHTNKKILVVEHNIDLDMDSPYLVYTGDSSEYELIKEAKLDEEYKKEFKKRTI